MFSLNRSVRTVKKCSARTACSTKFPCHRPSPQNVCVTCATASFCSSTPQTHPESLTFISVKNVPNWNTLHFIHIYAFNHQQTRSRGFCLGMLFWKGIICLTLFASNFSIMSVDEWCPPSGLMQYYLNCSWNQLYDLDLFSLAIMQHMERDLRMISGGEWEVVKNDF